MPHAAIYWCNFLKKGTFLSGSDSFNAARGNLLVQFSIAKQLYLGLASFNAARGNLLVQFDKVMYAISDYYVSMPHAAIYWCNSYSQEGY